MIPNAGVLLRQPEDDAAIDDAIDERRKQVGRLHMTCSKN